MKKIAENDAKKTRGQRKRKREIVLDDDVVEDDDFVLNTIEREPSYSPLETSRNQYFFFFLIQLKFKHKFLIDYKYLSSIKCSRK